MHNKEICYFMKLVPKLMKKLMMLLLSWPKISQKKEKNKMKEILIKNSKIKVNSRIT